MFYVHTEHSQRLVLSMRSPIVRDLFKKNIVGFANASTLGIHANESNSHIYPWLKFNFNGVDVELLALVSKCYTTIYTNNVDLMEES